MIIEIGQPGGREAVGILHGDRRIADAVDHDHERSAQSRVAAIREADIGKQNRILLVQRSRAENETHIARDIGQAAEIVG